MSAQEIAAGLWFANPHEYGPGKVHLVDAESQEKTLCGKFLRAIPGTRRDSGRATCKICLNAVETRANRKVSEEHWKKERERLEREREQQEREWRARYNRYMSSPEWREKASLVKKRANGICEGCGKNRATEVHHLTYRNLGSEFLWELRAICRECHERVHASEGSR